MESLSRDKVLRWFSGQQSQGGSSGDGGIVDLAGYATQIWTEQNYVGKEFFSSLFKAYDSNGNEVLPNDTETTIDNIKAMFGFWTDFYVSALGTGGQQSVDLRLAQLADVNVAGVSNGQVLTYDTTSGKWIASTPQAGTDMTTVWSNLAASGNQQINYSHLSGAVSLSNGTITIGSSSITPITSHQSLAGYAKEQWVGQNYLGLHATADAATKLATARTIWGQSFDGTGNVSGDMSSVGDIALGNGKRIYNAAQGSNGSLYIGRSDDAGWVKISDMCSRQGDSYWKIYSNGNSEFANVYSRGYVTALSDERKKNVVGDVRLTVEQIAQARAVMFRWKDKRDTDLHVGSIAQDWQKILPQAVFEKDGELSMDYSVIALMCGITIARKVEDHESRLRRLEKMFALNENDIEK